MVCWCKYRNPIVQLIRVLASELRHKCRMRCQRNWIAQTKKATLKVKYINNNPNPTNKMWSPNVAISVPKISPSKCPGSSNVARQQYRQGNNIVNPYRKTEPHFDNPALSTSTISSNVSRFQSSRKTMTNGTPSSIKPSPTKVLLINSINETNQSRRCASQPKSEIISESTQNKLHA